MEVCNNKKRIEYLDAAKGLAIISVVLGHSLTINENVFDISHPVLLNWISFFNVAVFFMVNGFLYKENSVESPIRSMFKKIKAYYIPYVLYNLFFCIMHNPFLKAKLIKDDAELYNIKEYAIAIVKCCFGKIQSLAGPMWFLRALIVISILYIAIDTVSSKIKDGKYRYIINTVLVIMITLIGILKIAPDGFNISAGCRYMLIFYLGVLYRKIEMSKDANISRLKDHKVKMVIGIVTMILSVVIANTTSVGLRPSGNYYLNYLAMIISTIFIISLAQIKYISNNNIIKYIGKSSLEIMSLHFLAFKVVSLIFVASHSVDAILLVDIPVVRNPEVTLLWSIAYTFVGIVLPGLFFAGKKSVKLHAF